MFWMTFQQMKLFDSFRPGDLKFLKEISAAHSFEEIFFTHLSVKELTEYLNGKMDDRSFRFMKISSENNIRIAENTKNAEQVVVEGIDRKSLNLDDFRESHSIKLYKLSDIFQYLSVIELRIEDCDDSENKDKNTDKNTKFPSTTSKRSRANKSEINSNKNTKKTKLILKSVSVNIFPAFFPLGFLFGFLFLLIPFSDFGVNRKYINELKAILNLNNVMVQDENIEKSVLSPIETKTENFLTDNILDETPVPPSTIFFFCFIICPVLLAAFFLLFF